jgi:hypothetical protein
MPIRRSLYVVAIAAIVSLAAAASTIAQIATETNLLL